MARKTSIVAVCIIITVVLGCSLLRTQEQIDRDKDLEVRYAREKLFDKRPDLLAEYGKMNRYGKPDAREELTKTPYLKGKIVILYKDKNTDTKFKSDSMSSHVIFNGVHATDPEDVQMVILHERSTVFGDNYQTANGSRAVASEGFERTITLIDRTINAVIFRKTFSPFFKSEANVSSDQKIVHGSSTDIELVKFLESLPKHP